MSPASTIHGGQHDAKYAVVTFELLLLHAAFVADEIGVIRLNQLVHTLPHDVLRVVFSPPDLHISHHQVIYRLFPCC